MATSAPNPTPDPRPTGDLEHLFRQKFAEAEVTPRAGLWEQLDHELLVEQNNTYRRKLAWHRWVAAACLLLFFSASGWAILHKWQDTTSGLAGRSASTTDVRTGIAANGQSGATTAAPNADALSGAESRLSAGSTSADTNSGLLASEGEYAATDAARSAATTTYGAYAAQVAAASQATAGASRRNQSRVVRAYQNEDGAAESVFAASRYSNSSASLAAQLGIGYATESNAGLLGWNGLAPRFANLRGGWLGARPDTLKASLLAVPQPGALAAVKDETQPPAKQWRRLRLGASYAAAAYNPNINFSHSDGRVQADAVTNALRNYYQDDAETEYRRNLKASLSQRVAVTAAYALNKHWTLVSGVEAAEQHATSATSYGFIDGRQVSRQVADLFVNRGNSNGFSPLLAAVAPAPARKTSYRYRTMAVPVEIRYGSAKPGTSLYAKVGAAVGLLLGTRSELEGSPEATRLYSLTSSDSPYRQVQTSVRGGAGVRYQPAAASWSLALGTTTEVGLTTLNANPSQRALNQARPYSIGIEASVDFGSAKPAASMP
ncbi:hypothetical protein J0X19_03980 [Hymenobacter sp. BT186]|uniref:Outer membrane protein beta-barrel domain-containing protein n=1 Tax=Hymenobacter telluris TaxID=2816474 RepID=A0A939EUU8_9BACT|nr:hypothetical protein [Hymenobacter telluris]MBO0357095.1 hypothetical protein [Hymenobacter telluris]MBW3373122.1 hypothetical protein [Hymenobacter norwichensis]